MSKAKDISIYLSKALVDVTVKDIGVETLTKDIENICKELNGCLVVGKNEYSIEHSVINNNDTLEVYSTLMLPFEVSTVMREQLEKDGKTLEDASFLNEQKLIREYTIERN